jgi:hypothetical protein
LSGGSLFDFCHQRSVSRLLDSLWRRAQFSSFSMGCLRLTPFFSEGCLLASCVDWSGEDCESTFPNSQPPPPFLRVGQGAPPGRIESSLAVPGDWKILVTHSLEFQTRVTPSRASYKKCGSVSPGENYLLKHPKPREGCSQFGLASLGPPLLARIFKFLKISPQQEGALASGPKRVTFTWWTVFR